MGDSSAVRHAGTQPLPASSRGVSAMPFGWTPRRHPALTARMRVAWESAGPAGAPVLFVLGGISANRHVTATQDDPTPGWWNRLVGGGRAVDPQDWRIVAMDFLGASGPDLGVPARLHLLAEDQADAVLAVLDHLSIDRVHAIVGSSYGGSVALAAALAAPERFARLVMLAAAHRSHPHATALRLVQRRIVELASESGSPARGLALARALAFTGYRTAGEFEDRFCHKPRWSSSNGASAPTLPIPAFEVSGYLDSRGESFAATTDPGAFLTLSESIDLCDLDPSTLGVPAYLVSFNEDTLVPPWLVGELEALIPGPCCHFRLAAKCGHDGFLMGARDLSAALTVSLSKWPDGESGISKWPDGEPGISKRANEERGVSTWPNEECGE